ncbi:hypothetical protein HanXRQr2_Chr14g0627121 [Helianthus annuus]|uniref:Uncharacterized protein n=1 Tax=Helianthus annuus TaxID=4232 RepID=A0A9K3E749_HELAN|nr:hypothetical protein HanXRQr2_Chr14g0627121 [Helianthus annuus]KAJ0839025.1 hypothetical protein HanPSC8_Chr14g0601861 [Helianthus annuus]
MPQTRTTPSVYPLKSVLPSALQARLVHISLSSFNSHITLLFQINLQIHNNGLTLQIPDLNTALSSRTQPIPIRTKTQSMNNRTGIKGIQPLPLTQIPQQNIPIFPTAGTQGAIRGDRHRVHIAIMTRQG